MLNNRIFLSVQLVVFCTAAAFGAYRAQSLRSERQLPPLRDTPLSVEPEYDYDVVITDEQLQRVLWKLRPPFDSDKTKINHVDHGLRFWTAEAEFDDDSLLSGRQMRRLLLDHRRFAEVFGEDTEPLLIDTPEGVRVRVQQGNQSSSHVDHTMACLAEVGTPLDFPLVTPLRETTYRAMVEQSLRDFSMNQVEYEWSAVTYALLLPPVRSWTTTEGQQMTFDRVAQRIMREQLPLGVCFGNHRLHGLVMLLRVDQQVPILEPETRTEIHAFLADATQRLVRHQHADGFWNEDWPFQAPASSQPSDREGDRLPERILATGHALEWWALAPEELHPPRHVLASAGQWLVQAIDGLTEQQTVDYFTYLSHAGRALSLWRSQTPPDVVRPLVEAQKATVSSLDEDSEDPPAATTVDPLPTAEGPPSNPADANPAADEVKD